jgi:hypothetical protein
VSGFCGLGKGAVPSESVLRLCGLTRRRSSRD